jgi:hypothetical protein
MTVTDTLFPDGIPADLREWGLVMPQIVRDSLIARQDAHGNPLHRLAPVPLTDGRWALNADVLTEAHEGGLFGPASVLDPQAVALVEVLPWDQVLTLLQVATIDFE